MRLTELLPDLDLGRAIPYYPRLRRLCGSVNAVLLLIQLLFWTGKQADPDGWIYKSSEEVTLEIGLSYYEQKTARAKLRDRGLIWEHYRRSDDTFFYKVNLEALKNGLADHPVDLAPNDSDAPEGETATLPNVTKPRSRTRRSHIPEREKASFPNEGTSRSLKGTSERTQEKTPEHAAAAAKGDAHSQRNGGRDEATAAFESALGVRGWPWDSQPAWRTLAEQLRQAWLANQDVFRRFARWMEREGRYAGINAVQIRRYPQQFLDTAWPLFIASRRAEDLEAVHVDTPLERRLREGRGEG